MSITRWSRLATRLAATAPRSAMTVVLLAGMATTSHAALRSPQVPVSGTALQFFFASQIQAINVVGSQLDAQTFSLPAGGSFQVLPFGNPSAPVGVYNAALASPALYQVYPGAASAGWSAVGSFRSLPDRLVVNLFDALNTFQGSNTYFGADRTDFGFYSVLAGGTSYSQDARNPGGRAQMLAYNGTGARAGSLWFAFESTPAAGGDYADAIFLVTLASAPVPATPSNWKRVKALFR